MIFDYQKVCSNLLKNLPERTKNIILERFGLETGERKTLEAIGKNHGVTRERIRQITVAGISKLKPKIEENKEVFQYFTDSLKGFGNLKKEDLLLSQLGGQKFSPHVFFLLTLSDQFERFSATKDIYSFWTVDSNSVDIAKEIINDLYNKLRETNQLLRLEDYTSPFQLNSEILTSYLEISKLISQGPEGKFGLRHWPEINPRGVKDKAFLVFKKEKRPLHFNEVARLIGNDVLVQTVHNELIRDPRFVLVGRGLYALSNWGYEPGTVKDVIVRTLEEAERPLSKEEILEKVLKKRLVKENTILLNLSNKKYFLRNPEGKYILKNVRDS